MTNLRDELAAVIQHAAKEKGADAPTYLFEASILAQAVIDHITPTLLKVLYDLDDIAKRGKEPFTSHKWLFYCRDVAEKSATKLRTLLGKGDL